jgi:hypothetical protein
MHLLLSCFSMAVDPPGIKSLNRTDSLFHVSSTWALRPLIHSNQITDWIKMYRNFRKRFDVLERYAMSTGEVADGPKVHNIIHPLSASGSPRTLPGMLDTDGGSKTHLRHIVVTFQSTLVLIHATVKTNDFQKIWKLYIYVG